MKKYYKIIFTLLIFYCFNVINVLANDLYFVDYSKVMNESIAGKKAQDTLKKLLTSSNKRFNDTAKKIKEEENKIISQKNVLTKEDYRKKAEDLRKKVFSLNKERDKTIRDIAAKRKKAGDQMLKNLNPILSKYMEENNITVVIDKKNVLMGNKKYEITSQIIQLLNKDLKSLNLN